MLIDINTYVGHWPFRKLRHNTPAKLLKLMDAKGIDQACVSSVSGVFYKNPQTANDDLAKDTKRYRDRLHPFAVINPTYVDWEHDLRASAEAGFKGIRIYPSYHAYTPDDACCSELASAAAEIGLIVSIPLRQTDARQRHWLINIPDMSAGSVAGLVSRHPKTRFMLVNGIGFTGSALGQAGNGLPDNYLIGISRMSALGHSEIRALIDNVGAERLAFGTGACLKYPDPPLVKIEVTNATRAEKDRIRFRNAAKWLK